MHLYRVKSTLYDGSEIIRPSKTVEATEFETLISLHRKGKQSNQKKKKKISRDKKTRSHTHTHKYTEKSLNYRIGRDNHGHFDQPPTQLPPLHLPSGPRSMPRRKPLMMCA